MARRPKAPIRTANDPYPKRAPVRWFHVPALRALRKSAQCEPIPLSALNVAGALPRVRASRPGLGQVPSDQRSGPGFRPGTGRRPRSRRSGFGCRWGQGGACDRRLPHNRDAVGRKDRSDLWGERRQRAIHLGLERLVGSPYAHRDVEGHRQARLRIGAPDGIEATRSHSPAFSPSRTNPRLWARQTNSSGR